MKRWIVCLLCLLLLASCAKQPQQLVIAGEESETVTLEAAREITADDTLDEAQITCTVKTRDGKVNGFEMRMPRTAQLHALFASEEHMYFGVVTCGSRRLSVPMEMVRILTDETTHEFVITLLLAGGDTVSGGACTVAFYVANRDGDPSQALFCAQKTVTTA